MTILFFDERFNFISAADGGVAQQQVAPSVGTNGDVLGLTNIKAPKNGYAYIYVSNQSNNDVYFDNLLVGKIAGNIVEENHYYAYGLRITAISSIKLGDSYEGAIKNQYLYNDKELFEDADLNWYDYGFRNYDPQVGKFVQLDPIASDYSYLTPFQYGSCDPITNIDLDGLEGVQAVGGLSTTAEKAIVLGEVVLRSSNAVSKISVTGNSLRFVATVTKSTLQFTSAASNVINTSIKTEQPGIWIPVSNDLFITLMQSKGVTGGGITFNKKKGWMLEDAFQRSYGFEDFAKQRFMPGPTYPDFVEPAYNVDSERGSGMSWCIFHEVKAVKEIRLTQQIKNEIMAAARMPVTGTTATAGEIGIAEFHLVTFRENLLGTGLNSIVNFAKQHNVGVSVSYPLLNPISERIKFSKPVQKNSPKVRQTSNRGIRIFVPFEKFFRWLFSKKVKLRASEAEIPDTNEDGTDI